MKYIHHIFSDFNESKRLVFQNGGGGEMPAPTPEKPKDPKDILKNLMPESDKGEPIQQDKGEPLQEGVDVSKTFKAGEFKNDTPNSLRTTAQNQIKDAVMSLINDPENRGSMMVVNLSTGKNSEITIPVESGGISLDYKLTLTPKKSGVVDITLNSITAVK